MNQSSNNWELFGFDVRGLDKEWRAAWRKFLWGYDSPVKRHLDEVVTVRGEYDTVQYQGGRRIDSTTTAPSQCDAVWLSDELVLAKTITMPAGVELDLNTVMVYEVLANSPFPENDTGYGWQLVEKREDTITVRLAIVSLSSTLAYIARQYDIHDIHSHEVWALVDDQPIVLSGFGENKREQLYRKRLVKAGGLSIYCGVILLLVLAVFTAGKYFELQKYRGYALDVKREATNASTMREAVLRANDAVGTVSTMQIEYPSPHYELARMTRLLTDDVYLESFSMTGRELSIRGRAVNAAEMMEMLIKEPAYSSVTAPQAIVKTPDGKERFNLLIALSEVAEG